MSGQPVAERVGGDFSETESVFNDLNERILDLEREGRYIATGESIIAVPTFADFPSPLSENNPPDWVFAVSESQWYQVQAGGGGGQPGWSPSSDSPNGST